MQYKKETSNGLRCIEILRKSSGVSDAVMRQEHQQRLALPGFTDAAVSYGLGVSVGFCWLRRLAAVRCDFITMLWSSLKMGNCLLV